MNKYKRIHSELILKAGGIVEEDLFVTKVGVLLTKKSNITSQAKDIFNQLNIDTNVSESEQHAEFNSRLTYLSFKTENSSSSEYNRKMIQEYGHRSVYNDEYVTFLIAGCSVETMLEFIAHNEATVARLTSSKTNAQNETLYRIQENNLSNDFIEFQKNMVKEYLSKLKTMCNPTNDIENEICNVLNLGNKAVSFTITMNIKDWHKTMIGRLSKHGVEYEMLEIMESILDILKKEYPLFFNTKEEYYAMNNSKKYNN